MYSYIYDEFLQDRRYERDLAVLETRLTDLGIMGKVTRLALFRDGLDIIRDEVSGGVDTIVAVGNDQTLRRTIEAVGESKTVIGYLPVGSKNILADLLGIPSGAEACEVLSARLVQDIDVGEVNSRRFFHVAEAEGTGLVLHCDNSYVLTANGKINFSIRNLAFPDNAGIADPTDGRLTIVLRHPRLSLFRKREDVSKIHIKKARLYAERHVRMLVDGEEIQAKEFDIRSIPGQLRLVMGKDRKF